MGAYEDEKRRRAQLLEAERDAAMRLDTPMGKLVLAVMLLATLVVAILVEWKH